LWWHTPVILALERWRQEDCECEASLGCIAGERRKERRDGGREGGRKKEGRKEGGRGRTSAMSSKSHMSKAWSPKQ
jgi:hypothetical protein